jgi:hypothetical protein
MDVDCATLDMDVLLFGFDRVDFTQVWRKASISRFDRRPRQVGRGEEGHPVIPNAGWHLEYFGRGVELMDKLHATSHAPEPGAQNMRRLVDAGELPGMERTARYPSGLLPNDVILNPQRYARHFINAP